MKNILSVSNLTKAYPDFCLDDISFSLPHGVIMGLIGENGAGKSTTLNIILGLIKKNSGKITLFGEDTPIADSKYKECIGVVFDADNYHEKLTPAEMGKVLAKIYRNWDNSLYEHYLSKFSLPRTKSLKTFSRGMKIKYAIAAALSYKPKLLILDEPTSGLDPVIRHEILDVFLDFIQDEQNSILVSSHILSDIERIADYVTFIHNGRLVFSKKKDELIYNYGIIRCGAAQFEAIEENYIQAFIKHDFDWQVLVSDKDKASKKYKGFAIDNATIEEIMMFHIKGVKK